jgi:dTDP-4-dehydrorhamnose reductase
MVVLVTGSNGQLGQSIQYIAKNHPEIHFVFCDSSELDITSKNSCEQVFSKFKPDYCINTAAYTAVDKAEIEGEKACLINVVGARNLAEICQLHQITLLHVSTDFVFDGTKTVPYTEEDKPNPEGVYGKSKLDGEIEVQKNCPRHFIVRTSWVYSQFGNNFMKTMLRLATERDSISVVNDQIGTPTNAVDLAEALIRIIFFSHKNPDAKKYGIYNFSNEGQCSWYDFAKMIFKINNIRLNLQSIPTSSYPTPARRPKYSVLDKSKIKRTFNVVIKSWDERLTQQL